jgi:tRNA A-37 threonylcarbamoyl transferase component Bud32
MNGANQNMSLTDYYFSLLKNLQPDSKLDLISKLSESLKSQEKKEDVTLESLFGAYQSDETAEEIIASIKSSRTFNRKTEAL